MELLSTINLLTFVLLLFVVPKIWEACWIVVLRPLMLSIRLKKQGISGPKYRILSGNLREMKKMKEEAKLWVLDPNSNDIFPRVFPHYHQWISQYGETFLYWNGTKPTIYISDPELAKQILSSKFGFSVLPKIRPEAMTKPMVDCTLRMFEDWRKQRNGEVVMKLEMSKEFNRLTADIIATTAFGSSYEEGIELIIVSCVPRYLPTPTNLKLWKLDKKVKDSIKRIIDARLTSTSKNYDDLLGIMLEAATSNESERKMRIDEIIDECKTFYFSGQGTSSILLTWTTMLLSLHQDWQEKLRQEVFKECGKDKIPDSDTVSKLKLMNMVLMESLRLYGPVIKLSREATQDRKVGHLKIPKGTTIVVSFLKMYIDKAIWGEDAEQFNPLRFENGIIRLTDHK